MTSTSMGGYKDNLSSTASPMSWSHCTTQRSTTVAMCASRWPTRPHGSSASIGRAPPRHVRPRQGRHHGGGALHPPPHGRSVRAPKNTWSSGEITWTNLACWTSYILIKSCPIILCPAQKVSYFSEVSIFSKIKSYFSILMHIFTKKKKIGYFFEKLFLQL